MGCFTSRCRKGQTQEDYGQFVLRAKDDKNGLLTPGASGGNDAALQLATTPTPLLKDVSFAPAHDGDSEPSVDDEAIKELLRRDDKDGGSD
jgi:hypothetical protein